MPVEFKLPDVGEGVAEGEIIEWLVEEGDVVEEDQPLVEVETDKAVVEIPSPVDGSIKERRVEEGEIVPVGTVIVVIEPTEEADTDADTAGVVTGAAGEASPTESAAAEDAASDGARVFAPPHVRRLARELGVDLATVEGTGPGGRVTDSDVRAAAEPAASTAPDSEPPSEPEPAQPTTEVSASPGGAEVADRERTLATPATRRVARELGVDLNQVPAVEERDGEAFVTPEAVRAFAEAGEPPAGPAVGVEPSAREERVAYRGVRRTIGQHMEQSKYTAPHVSHHDTADATALVAARSELKPHAEELGIRLTYLPFVMKAVVAAVKSFPDLNASLDEEAEEIVRKRYYNIGVATATDHGLLVPVVEGVDGKGLLQIASEIEELAEKARDRSISREEMQGGTFTVTNIGGIGGEFATPIINYPEVAILGMGAIRKRPRVVDDEVVPRQTLPLSLSFDHRVVDGATAAEFTNELIAFIENPIRLLIE